MMVNPTLAIHGFDEIGLLLDDEVADDLKCQGLKLLKELLMEYGSANAQDMGADNYTTKGSHAKGDNEEEDTISTSLSCQERLQRA
eukprot:14168082-Ditylum_brightwellii.AAC.1